MSPSGLTGGLGRLAEGHRWLLPLLVGLGLLAFAFEGLGITLLIPLLHRLMGEPEAAAASGNPLVGTAEALAARLDPAAQTPALVAAIVLCIALKGVTALASQAAFAYAGGRIGDDLRRRCFERVLRASPGFHDRQPPGALLNTLATETWRLAQGLQVLAGLVLHACAVVVFLALMLTLSWRLTLVVGVGVLASLWIVQAATSRARRYGDEAVRANERLAARIVEGLSGLATIRLFGRQAHEAARFGRRSDEVRRAFLRMDVLGAVPAPLLELLFAVMLGALILTMQGGGLVPLIVFLALLQRLQPHAAALMQGRTTLLGLEGALGNVFGVIDAADAAPLPSGGRPAPAPTVSIEFDDIAVSYPGSRRPALDGVGFAIPARRTTALVGASGAGKTTVLALLGRLIDPGRGAVRVDGVDLRELDLAGWRARCAVVSQEVFLFNDTVRENIAYGREGAGAAEVEAAARAAHAHDFVAALPRGYDTLVGERGARLSGGQRQRIALARALVRDADVLILDEATNALDGLSERLVRDALAEAAGERTVIVVAHRLSSVEDADHVVVLEAGRVVEIGPPADLRGAGGAFARLFDLARIPA